jgi:hypothetical protein
MKKKIYSNINEFSVILRNIGNFFPIAKALLIQIGKLEFAFHLLLQKIAYYSIFISIFFYFLKNQQYLFVRHFGFLTIVL